MYRAMRYSCLIVLLSLGGCGTITGIPGHGGGKRFAIEQELVAATARSAIKDLNVDTLKGKRVAVYVVGMGDEGAGNLLGGRYSIDALVRGEYVNTPKAKLPVVTTRTTTGATTTTAENALNYPVEEEGFGTENSIGARYRGLGAYHTEDILNPRDAQFLSAVLQEYLVLKGVIPTPREEADVDMYVSVDVFGTIRSRTDWHLVNEESLIAKTALEIMAISRSTGMVLVSPQTASFEAEYTEQYYLWAGPFEKKKELRRSEGLLADFTDLTPQDMAVTQTSGVHIPY